MNYEVNLQRLASRALRRLRGKLRQRLDNALLGLEANPRPHGCLKLTNRDEWRIRVGQYRVLYRIDDTTRQVTVTWIGHRRDAYEG